MKMVKMGKTDGGRACEEEIAYKIGMRRKQGVKWLVNCTNITKCWWSFAVHIFL